MVLEAKFSNTDSNSFDPQKMVMYVDNGEILHAINIRLNKDKKILFGTEETGYAFHDWKEPLQAIVKDGHLYVGNSIPLTIGESVKYQGINYQLVPRTNYIAYDLKTVNSFVIGPHKNDDLCIKSGIVNLRFLKDKNNYQLSVFSGKCYLNRELVKKNIVNVFPGDELVFDSIRMIIKEDYLQLSDPFGYINSSLMKMPFVEADLPEDYPNYHRSPRIIYRAPEGHVKIDEPQQQPSSPDSQLGRVILPPVLMAGMALIMTLVSKGNPVMVLSMVGMSLATVVTSITAYFKSKKDYQVNSKSRNIEYADHLTKKTIELNKLADKQAKALFYHYPDALTIGKMVKKVNSRIYEKTPLQHDFLTYRLGLGSIPASYTTEFEDDPFTKDKLVKDAMALKQRFLNLNDVPITSDLMHGPVGIIGQRELVIEQVQEIALQLATFQSYHDLQFISIFPEQEKSKWNWMRWLPHSTLQAMNVRGFIYHERSRDQILNSFYQILKERDQEFKENGGNGSKEKMIFSPHYVVFITHEELVLDHSIMEFFSKDLTDLGVSTVFVEDVIQSLPEQVKTVIDIKDYHNGEVVIEQGKLINHRFTPDHFPEDFDPEKTARGLAALNHQEILKNSIPKAVTFLEMYDKQRVEDLDVGKRWQEHEPFKTLAVPLGERGKDDIVNLNLHEKADGPHGLIAGTTGSGKSELVQSYILSLAVNFRPNDVGFLLIDYKGGGMANLFRHLPHLLGAITNLDGAQSMRALDSIKAELQRRQRLFGQFNVNHINQYQRLFNEGTATEPMPHLFLISDEFAELKTGQPEFMKELVSTARIGRSLGIHLILATQKPSGVVDDQIWSNSKFKISLKVQDKADSNEILHTPDAASIVEPGRAYLQVGNNEKYELFQSAWSGADYNPDQEIQKVDQTIYGINELGQYEVLTQDLSGDKDKKSGDLQKLPSELEAVINYIHDYAKEHGINRLPRPWLPPLEKSIPAPVIKYQQAWKDELNVKVAVGIVDIPSEQDQRPLELDLNENTHTAVIGSPGYGKSTFIQTMVMQLARQNNPEQINFYLLDFGTNGLLPLRDLPHVADLIRVDELEKLDKFLNRMSETLKTRKRLLNGAGVATLDQYAAATGKHLPVIQVVIDNYDAVRDSSFEDDFESVVNQIAREGAAIGIFLLVSANRQAAFRMQTITNMKTQISLYLFDKTEVSDIVGRTKLTIEDMPGRGLIKLDSPRVFQTYEPNDAQDSLHVLEQVKNEADQMKDAWQGELPESIPMVPDEFSYDEFMNRTDVKDSFKSNVIPLGLDLNSTKPVGYNVVSDDVFVIANDTQDQFTMFSKLLSKLIDTIHKDMHTVVLDPNNEIESDGIEIYANDNDDLTKVKSNLVDELQNRVDNNKFDDPILVIFNDIEAIKEATIMSPDEIKELINSGKDHGIYILINTYVSFMGNNYDEFVEAISSNMSDGIFGSRIQDQRLIDAPYTGKSDKYLDNYEAHYFSGHEVITLRLPRIE